MTDPMRPDSTEAGHLSLWDATSIIIGIVIGTTIFKSPQLVAQNVSGPGELMGAWLLGGLLALVGAVCYAELTTAYPRSGGDYVYLTRAFGPWVGFLFGWAQLAAILTGSIGAMAYALADYAQAFLGVSTPDTEFYVRWAAGSVVLMTALNVLGVTVGKTAQNALSLLKLVSLAAIVLVGLVRTEFPSPETTRPMTGAGFGLAMVFILYAYGGWNDAAFVASEVRDRRRNLPRALFLGTGGIMCIYLLVNLGYLFGLGFEGLRGSDAPAAELLSHRLGAWGGRVMSLIVMISALGAINGLIFAGSRVFATMGRDHRLFSWLGQWNERQHVPYGSLIIQAAVTVALIFAVGTPGGRDTLDRGLTSVGLAQVPWDDYQGGFGALVTATAPVFWSFFLLSGLSLFALREIDPQTPRPFKVPGYPFTPFVFCLTSVYMLYSSVSYAKTLSLLGLIPVAVGLPLYAFSRMMDKRASARMSAE